MGNGNGYPDELIESMQALSRLVVAEEDVSTAIGRIANLAVHAVESAEICTVSMVRNGEIETMAATDEIGEKIDELQRETNEGPCLASIEKQKTYRIPDTEQDETFPTFSRRAAAETGVKSALSFVLEVHHDARAALDLMSTKTDAFDDEDVSTGSVFAAQAGVVLANALTHATDQKKIEQLEEGLKTRQLIGQAVGIVMATRQVDENEAFQILVRISQNANVKLREVAQRLVEKAPEV